MDTVLESPDLLAMILSQACVSPASFVAFGRVCKLWRGVCHTDERILLAAAHSQAFLTKGVLVGLFALSSAEADNLPREVRTRKGGGMMYMYSAGAVSVALPLVGGLTGWVQRLLQRAIQQASIKQTFGPRWRETYRIGTYPCHSVVHCKRVHMVAGRRS